MKSNTKTALTAQVQTAFSDAQSSDNPLPAVPGPWDEPAGFAPEPSAPPIDCEAAARRAAADAETGGSAGRPAFAAPKRRPPREGEIDTRRIAARLRHNRVQARSIAPPPASGCARQARSPRRPSRTAFDARGDSDDGPGEPRSDRGPTRALPLNIDDWPDRPFVTSWDYREWCAREEDCEAIGAKLGKNRRRLIRIEARIVSVKNRGWSPQRWEDEDWADRLIKYGRPNGRERGEWLLAALKNPPDAFHILVIDHPTFKDAVGELPHDLRLAPGDRVSIAGMPYKWKSRSPLKPDRPSRPSLAFIPRDFRLLSSTYVRHEREACVPLSLETVRA